MPQYDNATAGNPYVDAFHGLLGSVKDFAQFLGDPNERQGIRQGFMDAVNRGAIGATLGAPVDMANTALNLGKAAVGYVGNKTGLLSADQMPQLIDNPIGGSEFIGNQMQRVGMVSPNRNALAEGIAGVLPMSPSTSAKAVAAIGAGGLVPGLDAAATVWHGSPHKFDRFDASKIGTGEGAQAYGHGLYLAENPKVATEYSKLDPAGGAMPSAVRSVNGAEVQPGTGAYKAASLLDSMSVAEARKLSNGWLQSARPEEAAYFKEVADTLAAIPNKSAVKQAKPAGSLYKVDLPDEHINKMLDWDKPLSQQAPEVQAVVESVMAKRVAASEAQRLALNEQYPARMNHPVLGKLANKEKTAFDFKGNEAVSALVQELGGAEKAANFLREAGIPGIRYLDGGSRSAGQGSSNYVVFPGNENMLRILERNGQAMPAPANALAPKKSAPVETPTDYGGEHRPPGPDNGAPLHDLTGGGAVYPDDVYGPNAGRYYGHGTPAMDNETVRILQGLKDKPNSTVTIYRAVPRETPPSEQAAVLEAQMKKFMARGTVPEGESAKGWYDRASNELDRLKTQSDPAESMNTINSGDWVTVNRNYAKEHGEGALNGKYKIISQKVKANEVFTNNDSIHEAGYWKGGKAPK